MFTMLTIKRLYNHVEVAHVGVLFGFVTLGISLLIDKSLGIWIPLAVIIAGVGLALSAAHNNYISKSTALIDKYDERFIEKMNRQRKSAALYLLGKNPNSDELEDVLDFFESPIGAKVNAGCIDAKQVYETFYHWIRLYYQASVRFREEYRSKELSAYETIDELFSRTSKYEKSRCKQKDLVLSQEDLIKYLHQEADLKTETSDWENAFNKK